MRSILLTALLTVTTVATGLAQPYDIQFIRPFEMNDSFQYTAEGSTTQKMAVMMNGQPMQDQSKSIKGSISALLTIQKVDEEGTPTESTFTVDTFAGEVDGSPVEAIEKGTVITAVSGEDDSMTFSIGDEKATGPTDELLQALLAIATGDSSETDSILGTDEPQSVGDEWDVSAGEMLESMKESGMQISADTVTGKAKLVEKVDSPVGEALKIEADINIDLSKSPMPMPIEIEEAGLVVEMDGLLPVDPEAHSPERQMTLSMKMKGAGEPQPGAKMEMNMTMEQDWQLTMVPAE